MKLGEFFIQLGIKGDITKLKTAIKLMEELKKSQNEIIKQSKVADILKDIEKRGQNLEKANRRAIKTYQGIEKAQRKVNESNLNAEKSKQLEEKSKQAEEKRKQLDKQRHLKETQENFKRLIATVSGGILAFDRIANAMFKANQQMINFNRQTSLSFSTLNKYASASAMVNYGSSVEKTANSLQTLASNLWDIRMGRGDLSPYQELAFVGGRGINPVGKSVEQVIEEVREAIKGVGDLQATNIIQRMGFAPDDLLMLRMSREEFEKINSLFLNPQDRETLNSYARQIKVIHLEFALMGQKIMLKVMPVFVKIMNVLRDSAKTLTKIGSVMYNVVSLMPHLATGFKILTVLASGFLFSLNPLLVGLGSLYLLLEDIAVYFMGGKSVLGVALSGFKDFGESLKNLNPFKNNGKGFEGFLRGINKLNALGVPPILQALIQSGFAIDKLNGMSFGGAFNKPIEWATDKILSPANQTNNSNKTFNQNNNISLNTNGAIAPQVADTIAQYTSVIGQNVAYG